MTYCSFVMEAYVQAKGKLFMVHNVFNRSVESHIPKPAVHKYQSHLVTLFRCITIYAVFFKGYKIYAFLGKLAGHTHKILVFEKGSGLKYCTYVQQT